MLTVFMFVNSVHAHFVHYTVNSEGNFVENQDKTRQNLQGQNQTKQGQPKSFSFQVNLMRNFTLSPQSGIHFDFEFPTSLDSSKTLNMLDTSNFNFMSRM